MLELAHCGRIYCNRPQLHHSMLQTQSVASLAWCEVHTGRMCVGECRSMAFGAESDLLWLHVLQSSSCTAACFRHDTLRGLAGGQRV